MAHEMSWSHSGAQISAEDVCNRRRGHMSWAPECTSCRGPLCTVVPGGRWRESRNMPAADIIHLWN